MADAQSNEKRDVLQITIGEGGKRQTENVGMRSSCGSGAGAGSKGPVSLGRPQTECIIICSAMWRLLWRARGVARW